MKQLFRALPSVDAVLTALLDAPEAQHECAQIPRALFREYVNDFLDQCRAEIRNGKYTAPEELALTALLPRLVSFIHGKNRPHFRRTLNATGVVVHTNMGRSVLAEEAVHAVSDACANYSNLEFDLATGERGSRYSHVEQLLMRITGAEAALVVNNNAAAVLIVLDTLCKGKEVIISRGELVEVGGSFRIPDVMTSSGAKLCEVGATNRTHLADYERAITDDTAALVRVHTSNYRIVGFHKDVPLPELVELGRKHNLPVIEDLGSGVFYDFSHLGLGHEPTVQQIVADGADVVTFSGDKVLGGPQAGIIVGRKDAIERIKRNPMNRALRIDKMTLAALEATLRLYTDLEIAKAKVPTLRMILAGKDELKERAQKLARRVRRALGNACTVSTAAGSSRVGGGSFPERDLPTTLVRLSPAAMSATELKKRLLAVELPLIGRLEDDSFCLDVRTLRDDEFALVTRSLQEALGLGGKDA